MQGNSKEIIITRESLIWEIEKEFVSFYPFLKIEFSTNSQGILARNNKVNSGNTVSKITRLTTPVILNVEEDRTIAEVENDCRKLLGLSIQIFRKSGNVWNAISITNSWTLKSQNTAGEFISKEMQKA